MLVHEGQARTPGSDRRLAWPLAGIAGALNAAGFCAFGTFSSNMTGNVSALADHLGLGELALALPAVALVGAFLAGAVSATLLIGAGRHHRLRGIYAYSVLTEALLLAGLGVLGAWMPEAVYGPVLVTGLSFLLGLQNATVTQITDARVRTTHVTGMVTDLGIGLGSRLARRGRGMGPDVEKIRLYGVTVAAFLAGGVAGVVAWRALGHTLLFAAAAMLALMAVPGIASARRLDPP
ncbi:YoaK family protein [Methylorubrum thiocyanatum]|uniref:YoaK family protein n=1 Tax=Methylorubrum thiocyanatum TaxID=47958 RepID=UPI00383ABE85